MPRAKYNEANVPDGLIVKVRYIKDQRWFTRCELIEGDRIVASATASCSYKDQPARKIGRAIAVGRAIKAYKEGATNG